MITEILQKELQYYAESDSDFPFDFNRVWQWIGYARKDVAKKALFANFKVGYHFRLDVEMVLRPQGGGRRAEQISLSKDCFKEFCMMAGTEKGREVRQYYIQCEERLKSLSDSMILDSIPHEKLLLKAFEVLNDRAKQLEAENAEMRPTVIAHQVLTETKTTYSFREAAQLIAKKAGIEIGQNRLFAKCVELGLLDSSKQPYQRYIDNGLFIKTLHHVSNINKNVGTVRFTGKGLDYIIKKFLNETGQLPGILPALEAEQ